MKEMHGIGEEFAGFDDVMVTRSRPVRGYGQGKRLSFSGTV
jgi:hypothetical protein